MSDLFAPVFVDDATRASVTPKPSRPSVRTNECKGSRLALQGNPLSACPYCGRQFEMLSMLVRGSDVAFPPHKPPSVKEKRQAAAAKGRAERERRIAADRINHVKATAAFLQWAHPDHETRRKERVSAQDAAHDNGRTDSGSSHAASPESEGVSGK